ncbi:MAG: exlusion protein FxsA, partial [Gammaproteobacteria bacterium]
LVFTAVLGALLVRMQGLSTYIQIQQAISQGRMPATEMIEGVMIMFAGVLLLTPGFITDAVGFVFLVPSVRRAVVRAMIKRQIQTPPSAPSAPRPVFQDRSADDEGRSRTGRVIEGELDDD